MTHKTTLQGVVYQLDIALQSPDTQRNGIIFIYDMSGSKYSNFDYELSQKILTMLKVSAELIHYGYGWEEKQIATKLQFGQESSFCRNTVDDALSEKRSESTVAHVSVCAYKCGWTDEEERQ